MLNEGGSIVPVRFASMMVIPDGFESVGVLSSYFGVAVARIRGLGAPEPEPRAEEPENLRELLANAPCEPSLPPA